MSPELREYVLSLPLDVRLDLAKCDGLGWWVIGAPGLGALVDLMAGPPGGEIVFDDVSGNLRAWLPASPIAINQRAMLLTWAGGQSLGEFCDRHVATLRFPVANKHPRFGLAVEAVEYNDPTGHRAAIALLQKVMADSSTNQLEAGIKM